MSRKILIVGSSDLESVIAMRFFKAGILALLIDRHPPYDLSHHRSFSTALHSGKRTLHGMLARALSDVVFHDELDVHAEDEHIINYILQNREIPILTIEQGAGLNKVGFDAIIIINFDSYQNLKPLLKRELPIFILSSAKEYVKNYTYAISDRNEDYGAVLYPEYENAVRISSHTSLKHINEIKASKSGVIHATVTAGAKVSKGTEILSIDQFPVYSPVDGQISGIMNSGIYVDESVVVAQIQSGVKQSVQYIPPEKRAIAGGFLEAFLYHFNYIDP
ncbi:MAG: hypothetical protein GF313_13230 [Caldithrix sp.]|nr:hypothetical protein [Caldithrix sp.]